MQALLNMQEEIEFDELKRSPKEIRAVLHPNLKNSAMPNDKKNWIPGNLTER